MVEHPRNEDEADEYDVISLDDDIHGGTDDGNHEGTDNEEEVGAHVNSCDIDDDSHGGTDNENEEEPAHELSQVNSSDTDEASSIDGEEVPDRLLQEGGYESPINEIRDDNQDAANLDEALESQLGDTVLQAGEVILDAVVVDAELHASSEEAIPVNEAGAQATISYTTIVKSLSQLVVLVAVLSIVLEYLFPPYSTGIQAPTIDEILKAGGDPSVFHIDRDFWNELNSVTQSDANCLFKAFILVGHSPSHVPALQSLLYGKNDLQIWTTAELLKFVEAMDENTELSDGSFFVLVKNADELDTRDIESLFRVGGKQCAIRNKHKKRHSNGLANKKLVLFLSTDFGSDRLDTPDDVMNNRYIDDTNSFNRDWLTIPQIVLNSNQIVFGIKGLKPRVVFQDFFEKKAGQLRSEFTGTDAFALESWLDTKLDYLVLTPSANKILQKKLSQRSSSEILVYIESLYQTWTRNQSCKVVVYKQSNRDLGVYEVKCTSTV